MNVAKLVVDKVFERTGLWLSLDRHVIDIMPIVWKLVESYENELNNRVISDDSTSKLN